jgi:N,N'-diacetylchitobiose transport system permease protein
MAIEPAMPGAETSAPGIGAPGPGAEAKLGRAPDRARRRGLGGLLPYLLILPSIAAFGLLLGYPLYKVIAISFQQLGLAQLFARETVWIGVANFTGIFTDSFFWTVLVRTVVFTAACVVLTMVGATLVALLMHRLGRGMRMAVSVSMLLAWAMPIVTVTVVWQWMFDTQFGLVNWLLTRLPGVDFTNHSWFASGLSTFFVITIIVVWQAIPFVAFTLYAGLTSIPRELFEAMRIDCAGAWRTFWSLVVPLIKPLFMITAFLSIIWDFKVFTQVWLVRQGGPNQSTVTLPIYAYQQGIASAHFGKGAAISVAMVVMLLAGLVIYIRRMLQTQDDL